MSSERIFRIALGLLTENSLYNTKEALIQAEYLDLSPSGANRDLIWSLEQSGYSQIKDAHNELLRRLESKELI